MPTLSPFTKYANATITFQIPTGSYTIDPVTGNPTSSTTATTVKAILNPSKADPKYYEGADESWEVLEGYWVDPLTPPAGIVPGMVGTATVTTSIGLAVSGSFRLLPITQDPFVIGANVTIISPIKGLFRRQ